MSLSLSLKAIFQDSKHPILSLSEYTLCHIRSFLDYKHPSSLPINDLMDTYNQFMQKLLTDEYHIYSLHENDYKMTILQGIAKKREVYMTTWRVDVRKSLAEIFIVVEAPNNEKLEYGDCFLFCTSVLTTASEDWIRDLR